MKKLLLLIATVQIVGGTVFAQTERYWVTGGDGNWNSTDNWSATSGGASGGTVPNDNTFKAIFDANSGSPTVTLGASITVGQLQVTGSQSVTLSAASAYTLSVGNAYDNDDLAVDAASTLTLGTNVSLTLLASNTADIGGTLAVGTGVTYTTSASGAVTTVTGTINNSGTITGSASGLVFDTLSWYNHTQNAGTIPTATWNATSTCEITGVTSTLPGGIAQTFGNLTWNCAGQSANVNINSNLTINGTFRVQSTSTYALLLTAAASTSYTITSGSFVQDDGTLTLSNQSGRSGTLSVSGSFTQNGGTINKTNTNASNEIKLTGSTDVVLTLNGTITSSDTNPLTFNVEKGTNNATLPVDYSFDAGVLLKLTSGTIDFGASSSTITVNGSFTMVAGTIDMSGAAEHIFDLKGTVTYTAGSLVPGTGIVKYSGAAQSVMPFDYNHLTVEGSGTKTLLGAIEVKGNLNVGGTATLLTNQYQITGNASGTLTLGAGTGLTLGASGNATNVLFPTLFTSIGIDPTSTVTYQANTTQTVSGVPTYGNLTLQTATTKTLAGGSGTVSIAGNLTVSAGTFNLGTDATSLSVTGTTSIAGTLNFGTTAKTVSLNDNLSGAGTLSMSGAGLAHVLNLKGASNAMGTLSTTDYSGSTVNYNLAGAQTCFVSPSYQNLTISGSGIKTFATTPTVKGILSLEGEATITVTTGVVTYGTDATLRYNTSVARTATAEEWLATFAATGGVIIDSTGVITLNGAKVFNSGIPLTINSGATLNTSASNYSLSFGGDFVNNGTLQANASAITIATTATSQSIGGFTTTGTVSMTKTGGTATMQGNMTAGALTINGSGGNINLGAGLTHTISGTWTRTNGTLNGGSSTLKLEANVSGTGGTFTANTGTVDFSAADAQTIPSLTYYNLTASGSGTKTAGGNLTINQALTIGASCMLDMSTNRILGTLATVTNDGTIKTSSTNALPVPADITWDGTFEYSKTDGGQTVVTGTYNNLTLLNSSSSNSFGGVVTVDGAFVSTSGGTFSTANNLNFNGTTSCGGGSINATAGTVTYGASATNIIGGTYYNVVIPDNATLCGNITVDGSLTLGSGLDYNSYSISGIPVVTSVSATNDNGTFKINDVIDVTVTFSKIVTVTGGPPQLELNIDGVGRLINYTSGSPSATLTFSYTVQENDVSSDLDYISTDALSLNGATIRDASSNDAILTLPTPGAAGSLGANKNIVIDGVVPALTSVQIQSNNANDTKLAKPGDTITLSFSGSEPLTSKPTVTIAGNTIAGASITNPSGNNWEATYQMVSDDPTGTVQFTIDFTDIAGNQGDQVTTITTGNNVTFDKTLPTLSSVTIVSNNGYDNKLAKVADVITLQFTGSEVLKSKPSVTIATHAIASGNVINTGGNTWQATYSMVLADVNGVIPFTINYTDLAGNAGDEVTQTNFGGTNVVFDKTAPTVSISSNKTHTNNNPFTLTITFNEDVRDFVATDVSVTNGTRGTFTETTANRVWTLEITPNGGGNITCSIASNSCTDLAGNGNVVSNSVSVIYDNIPPTLNAVSIASDNTNPAYVGVDGIVTLTITGSESLVINPGDVLISGNIASLSGSGANWTASYTMTAGDAEGIIPFEINYSDLAGNLGGMVNTTTNTTTVTFDNTKPELTEVKIVSSNLNNNSLAIVGDLITLSFTANDKIEAVTVTIKGKSAVVTNTDYANNKWEAYYTMSSSDVDGNVNFTIDFKDFAGNHGDQVTATTATPTVTSVTFDKTKPTLSAVSITSNNTSFPTRAGIGHIVTVQFTANESLFSFPTVTIAGHEITGNPVSGNTWNASYQMTVDDDEGVIPFLINFSDLAGNAGNPVSSLIPSGGTRVTFDKTKPVFSGISITNNPAGSYSKVDGIITVSFTSSENVTTPTVTINGIEADESGGPTAWSFTRTLTGTEPEGLLPYSISATDYAGNVSNVVNGTSSIFFDRTPPVISSVTVPSGKYKKNDVINVTITADDDIYAEHSITVNGVGSLPFTNNNNNTYTVAYTVGEFDTQRSNVASLPVSIQLVDFAGNTNAAFTSATVQGGTLTIDTQKPVIQQVFSDAQTSGNLIIGQSITFTVVPVTFESGLDINPKIYNSKSIAWIESNPNYIATYTVVEGDNTQETPLDLGSVTITDPTGNISDAVNYTGVQKSIYATKPTVAILGTTSRCSNEASVPITFEMTGYKPFNLTYIRDGVEFNVPNIDDYTYVTNQLSGSFSLANLTDAKGNFTTSATQNAVITVNDPPVLTFDIIGSPFKNDADEVSLMPFVTPTGGTFSGKGVGPYLGNWYFYPKAISSADYDKDLTLTYTYTNPGTGCTNTINDNVKVSSGAADIVGLDQVYCNYADDFTVTGSNNEGLTGIFSVTTSPPGTWIASGNSLTIKPSLMKAGTHMVNYRYDATGSIFNVTRTFRIDSVGQAVDFLTLNDKYCVNAEDVSLLAVNLYPSGGTGHFTGPATGFATSSGSNSALFQPSLVAPNQTYTISYFYQSPDGCKSPTKQKQATVYPLPTLTFDLLDNYNYDGDRALLSATPSGGEFTSAAGIVKQGAEYYLYPNLVIPGDLTVRYSYTNQTTGCGSFADRSTRIIKATEIISGLGSTYCYSTDTLNISCAPDIDPTIVGEFISKRNAVIASETANQARYAIAAVGNGVDTVFYRYTVEGTQYQVFTRVLVDSIGAVTISGIEGGYCIDHGQVQVFGIDNHPQGSGVFTYTGKQTAFSDLLGGSAIFRPSLEDVGSYSIKYTYTSGLSTCKSETTIPVSVYPLPNVSFTLPSYYNIDDSPYELVGVPAGGVFTGNGVSGNAFYPKTAGVGSSQIVYQFTDGNSCVNSATRTVIVIGPDAQIQGIPSTGRVCIDGESLTLVGSSTNGHPGSFEGNGITNTQPDRATFNPATAGAGTHTITYTYRSNADGVTILYITANIEVIDLEEVNIIGYLSEYCEYLGAQKLIGSPQPGTFSGNGIVGDEFYPTLANVGVNVITYTHTASGCSVSGSVEVKVNSRPTVEFDAIHTCSNLTTDSVQFINNTTSADEVVDWLWNFGTNEVTSTDFEPKYLYRTAGSKFVTLRAETNKGCFATGSKEVKVGEFPVANFIWINECLNGQATSFTSTSTSAVSLDNYQWVIDGTTYEGSTMSNITHEFSSIGEKNVKLLINTQDNCPDSITKVIQVQPLIRISDLTNNIYFEDFEAGTAYWSAKPVVENSYLSWEFGEPSGSVINQTSSGANTWFTAINNENQVAEHSQLLSPCFDFRDIKKPMLKFNVWTSNEVGRNGSVLQYTVNNGVSWENLGDLNTGINWFNSNSIKSQPAGQLVGWSANTGQWVSARHSLDRVKEQPNVRFRIAFAADGFAASYFDGIAFDDFWIGNREQKLLIEYFTNTTLASTVTPNANMRSIEQDNWLDLVAIHYHTSSPSGDPFNSIYRAGPSSREFLYGVTAIPYALVNGQDQLNFTNFSLNQPILDIEKLKDPTMEINVDGTATSTLNLQASVKMLQSVESSDLVMYCAVVQKIVSVSEPINGVTEFYSVLRGFAPDPGGTQLKSTWTAGESQNFNLSWSIPPDVNPEMIRAIVFVQNIQTGEVYQTGYFDASPATSVDPKPEHISVAVFPNPASSFVRLVSPQTIEQAAIFDLTGRIIKVYSPTDFVLDIPVQHLVNGIYFVKLKLRNGQTVVRFVKE